MSHLHLRHVAWLSSLLLTGCAVESDPAFNRGGESPPPEEEVGEATLAETVAAPGWNCDWSSSGGKQYKTCVGGPSCKGRHANVGEHCPQASLFYCESDGSPKKEICQNGCVGFAEGTDDQCE